MKYIINENLANLISDYTRGVIVMSEVVNDVKNDSIYLNFLGEVRRLHQMYKDDDISKIATVNKWKKAFQTVGIKSEFKPSFESLIRRVVKKPDGFKAINPLVDLGNYCSLIMSTSIGVHPIEPMFEMIELRYADGTESFMEFGKNVVSHPKVGEVILLSGNNVLARNWVWRQSQLSMITPNTKNVFINVDCLGMSQKEAEDTTKEVANIFRSVFHRDYKVGFLNCQNPEVFL
jgi:DNA/RNA-binding domain of Phe-tRNA-synthetase-like protein